MEQICWFQRSVRNDGHVWIQESGEEEQRVESHDQSLGGEGEVLKAENKHDQQGPAEGKTEFQNTLTIA